MKIFFNRIATALLTIITSCVLTIVGFIWSLKSEFAAEREKTSFIRDQVTELKIKTDETLKAVQTLEQNQIRTDARVSSIESSLSR